MMNQKTRDTLKNIENEIIVHVTDLIKETFKDELYLESFEQILCEPDGLRKTTYTIMLGLFADSIASVVRTAELTLDNIDGDEVVRSLKEQIDDSLQETRDKINEEFLTELKLKLAKIGKYSGGGSSGGFIH